MSQTAVTPAFGATSIIAPLLGVFAGGAFIDKIGGYKGAGNLATTLKCCAVFTVFAAGFAISCAFVPKAIAQPGADGQEGSPLGGFISCIGLIAATLVFGGAVIPAATGCIVSCVPPDLRQVSSAGSMFVFQQLGYALSPLVSALVASAATIDEDQVRADALDRLSVNGSFVNATLLDEAVATQKRVASLELCFIVVMMWGILGVIFMVTAWRFAVHAVDYGEDGDGAKAGGDATASGGPADAMAPASDDDPPSRSLSIEVSGRL